MNETALTNKVRKLLTERGAYHEKIFGGGFQSAGIPDIIACLDGKFLAIEMKSPTKKGVPSDIQRLKVLAIRKAGGIAFFSHTYEEVVYILDHMHVSNFLELERVKKIYKNYY